MPTAKKHTAAKKAEPKPEPKVEKPKETPKAKEIDPVSRGEISQARILIDQHRAEIKNLEERIERLSS